MIMRVGGRFPYLQKPESVFTAQGKGKVSYVVVFVCVSSLYLLCECVYMCMG